MDVGKPQRVYRVEPLRSPVPSKPEPRPDKAEPLRAKPVPAR
jgi:hypothetical protein